MTLLNKNFGILQTRCYIAHGRQFETCQTTPRKGMESKSLASNLMKSASLHACPRQSTHL